MSKRSGFRVGLALVIVILLVSVSTNLVGADSTSTGCRVYNNASISIPNWSWTAVTFNSERWDPVGMHSTSTNTGRLTCVTAGVYLITGSILYDANAVGVRGILLRVNGGTNLMLEYTDAVSTGQAHGMTRTSLYYLHAGDYVELLAVQSSGASLNVGYAAQYSPELTAELVSGEATVAWVVSQNYSANATCNLTGYATQSWVSDQDYATENWVTSYIENYGASNWEALLGIEEKDNLVKAWVAGLYTTEIWVQEYVGNCTGGGGGDTEDSGDWWLLIIVGVCLAGFLYTKSLLLAIITMIGLAVSIAWFDASGLSSIEILILRCIFILLICFVAVYLIYVKQRK